MKKSVSNVFFRQYVIQKAMKRGNGNSPLCTFCRKPSTLIAQGTVFISDAPAGLSFYEPVCEKDAAVMKEGKWPGKEKPIQLEKDSATIAEQTSNQQEEVMATKKSAKSSKVTASVKVVSAKTAKAKAPSACDLVREAIGKGIEMAALLKKVEAGLKAKSSRNPGDLTKGIVKYLESKGELAVKDGKITIKGSK